MYLSDASLPIHLLQLFDLSLQLGAHEPALEWEGETYTFGDIERRSHRVAHALLARGFQKGDRLCVYMANRLELIDLYLACIKTGVISTSSIASGRSPTSSATPSRAS